MNIQLIDRWIRLMIFAWEDELMDGMIEWCMNEPHSNITKVNIKIIIIVEQNDGFMSLILM